MNQDGHQLAKTEVVPLDGVEDATRRILGDGFIGMIARVVPTANL